VAYINVKGVVIDDSQCISTHVARGSATRRGVEPRPLRNPTLAHSQSMYAADTPKPKISPNSRKWCN